MEQTLIDADPPARINGGGMAHAAGATVNDPRTGQFRTGSDLTPQQREFVRNYVRNGANAVAAAEAAGYGTPKTRAWELTRHPAIMVAVREEMARTLYSEVAAVSVATVLEVMQDKSARPADRVAAARLGMEAAKLIKADKAKGENPLGSKALADMNMDELETFITAGNKALADKQAPKVIEGSAQDSAQVDQQQSASD